MQIQQYHITVTFFKTTEKITSEVYTAINVFPNEETRLKLLYQSHTKKGSKIKHFNEYISNLKSSNFERKGGHSRDKEPN